MSGVFVEDPWSRIVDVNWKKKDKPPEPPGGRPHMGKCGGYYWEHDRLYSPFPNGIMVLESQYLCLMFFDLTPGYNHDVPCAYANPFWHYFPHLDGSEYPYTWSSPRSYTISHPGFRDPFTGALIESRVAYGRNLNIQLLATAPFGTAIPVDAVSSPMGSLQLEGWRPDEFYPPFVMVEEKRAGDQWLGHRNPGLDVRAHCDEESAGLPPQFLFWKGWNPPYPAPGNVKWPLAPDPITPPPGPAGTAARMSIGSRQAPYTSGSRKFRHFVTPATGAALEEQSMLVSARPQALT